MSKQNNILIVMADQLSAKALGCYGHPVVKSPNIDQLAAEGVLFESAYSSSPLCTPARYAFMTGQNISNCKGYDNASYLPATMPTFAHYLRLMGYRTCLAGKMHFVGADQLHGFEERLTTDVYPADFGWIPDWNQPDERIDLWYHNMSSVKQAGVAAISNQLAYDEEVGYASTRALFDHARGEDERPLCLVTSFIHPHDPYATPQEYWDRYDNEDIDLPKVPRPAAGEQDAHNQRLEQVIALDAVDISEQEIRNARRAYYGNISYVDDWVGRLRQTLAKCGMADNTTIIFTSDHGDMLGEFGLWYKMSFREWSNRIPLIIHRPGRYQPKRVASPVAQVDVLPTLLQVAYEGTNTPIPEPIDRLDGRSLVALCDGDLSSDPQACVSEFLGEGTGAPMLMLRQDSFKFITCPTDPDMLFDLAADPDELINLATNPDYADRLGGFKLQADKHWDVAAVREEVIADQVRRRRVHEALRIGRYQSWDFQPQRDASQEYSRSHLDLTKFDISSRFPRPVPFKPRQH